MAMAARTDTRRSLIWASDGAPLAPPPGAVRAAADAAGQDAPSRARDDGPSDGCGAPASGRHPLACPADTARLFGYDSAVKEAFDRIDPAVRRIAAAAGEAEFAAAARAIARAELELDRDLPPALLAWAADGTVGTGALYAWAVFETARAVADRFFREDPLGGRSDPAFAAFLHDCGFHAVDISPCADGRLAHTVSQVLRLPYGCVRRRSHAGALFDIEDTVRKWVELEMHRYREGRPTPAHRPTHYLKIVVYHTSESDPAGQGCAAHRGDTAAAARAGLHRLQAFRDAVEAGFCCGASVDLLLIGLDTDTDAIRLHMPDRAGTIDPEQALDARDFAADTRRAGRRPADAEAAAAQWIRARRAAQGAAPCADGMVRFCARLLAGNVSQIDLVAACPGGRYPDLGHAERFMGLGIGFEEIQLRNLTYFAYLHTVEEGAADLDVGVKILEGLNAPRGLPVPAIVRFDYHGTVPGARDRALTRARRTEAALHTRFADRVAAGRLHTARMVRDCADPAGLVEIDGGTVHDRVAAAETDAAGRVSA